MLVVLSLAVGTVAAIDLRRLQTPTGTALAWTGAAVFGDCTAYERLSIATASERRSDAAVCVALRAATADARAEAAGIGIELRSIEQRGREATAQIEIRRGDAVTAVELPMRRKGDGWAVVLTDEVCDVIGCP